VVKVQSTGSGVGCEGVFVGKAVAVVAGLELLVVESDDFSEHGGVVSAEETEEFASVALFEYSSWWLAWSRSCTCRRESTRSEALKAQN